MTPQEFTQRTKVQVTSKEFDAIHEVYMNSEVDKDEFCKLWCKMNKSRVENAKAERIAQQRDESYKNTLYDWFWKWSGKSLLANWDTQMAYIEISVYEVKAISYAGISVADTLSNVHFKVGQYLGIIKK